MDGTSILDGWLSCGCYDGPWWGTVPAPRCATHPWPYQLPVAPVNPLLDQRRPFSSDPDDRYHKLSDADVDRIVQRVVELLREQKP